MVNSPAFQYFQKVFGWEGIKSTKTTRTNKYAIIIR